LHNYLDAPVLLKDRGIFLQKTDPLCNLYWIYFSKRIC